MVKQLYYRYISKQYICIYETNNNINKKIIALKENKPFRQQIYKNFYYYERYEAFYARED